MPRGRNLSKNLIWILMIVLLSSFAYAHSYVPLNYYRLDDSGLDSGTNGSSVTGTIRGYVPAIVDNGADLEVGNSDYLENASFDSSNNVNIKTIDFWHHPESEVSYQRMFSLIKVNMDDGFLISADDTGVYSVYKRKAGATVFNYKTTKGFDIGVPTHVVVTANSSGTYVIFNGTIVEYINAATSLFDDGDANVMSIGRRGDGNSYYDGVIDNVAMLSNSYSMEDALWSYNDGNGRDFLPDTTPPVVHSVVVDSTADNVTHNFTANVTDDGTVDTVLIELESPSNVKTNYTMNLVTGDLYNYSFETDEDGTWTYTVFANDTEGNSNDGLDVGGIGNFTGAAGNIPIEITEVYLTSPDPDVKLYSPKVTGNTTDTTPTFSLVTDVALATCHYGTDNVTWTECATTGAIDHICTQGVALDYGLNTEYFMCNNTKTGLDYQDVNFTVFDIPSINLTYPDNDVSVFEIESPFTFNFTVFDDTVGSVLTCDLYVDEVSVESNNTIVNNDKVTFITALSEGYHNWTINCSNDYISNGSERRYLNVTIVTVSSELCANISSLEFLPNLTYFNMSTNTITQYDILPTNNSGCGWTYKLNYTYSGGTNLYAKLNETDSKFIVSINQTNLTDSYQIVYTGTIPDTNYYLNVTGSYVNANQSWDDWKIDWTVI